MVMMNNDDNDDDDDDMQHCKPESKLSADDDTRGVSEPIVTDRSPCVIMPDLETTFSLRPTGIQSHWNRFAS